MIGKDLLNRLKDFGINSYESKIWAALLMKGVATAGSLSELAGVPRSRCYDVLESLEKKGFIVAKLGRPLKYVAVAPDEALDRVKVRIQHDTEERLSLLDSLAGTPLMDQLNKIYTSGSSETSVEDITGIIKSRKNIDNHLLTLVRNAKKEVLVAADKTMKGGYFIKYLKSNGRKVKVRVLSNDVELSKELKSVASVKNVQLSGAFCITDTTATLLLNQDNEPSALWVNSPAFVNSLRDLFESKWASC
jgi:sugar-specific transcriptional regulator TrmB